MTRSVSPEQLQQLMAGYVLYDLSPEDADTLAVLLAADPALQRELDQLQATLDWASETEPVTPPAHLKAKILQGATPPQAIAISNAPERRSRSTPQPQGWWRGLGAVAALVIVGLGINNYRLWRTLQAVRQERPPGETLTVALGQPDAPTPATAQVVINPATLEGSLTVDNLPPLPPGMVYVLWTVVDPNAPVTLDDKDAILTTVFTVDDQGQVSQSIDLPAVYRRDLSWVRAVAITQERAEAPQEHLSAPILIQPF
jgi:hypothetical protein